MTTVAKTDHTDPCPPGPPQIDIPGAVEALETINDAAAAAYEADGLPGKTTELEIDEGGRVHDVTPPASDSHHYPDAADPVETPALDKVAGLDGEVTNLDLKLAALAVKLAALAGRGGDLEAAVSGLRDRTIAGFAEIDKQAHDEQEFTLQARVGLGVRIRTLEQQWADIGSALETYLRKKP